MPPRSSVAASQAASPGYAKSLDTRARILAAALDEAGDSGFHKASVARIAARAGVAVGNLNYHFGSRGELLRVLMGSLMADLLPRLHDADSEEGADFFARERAALLAYLSYLRANPAHIRLANEIRLCEPELYRRALRGWLERIAARIRAGIERGALAPMDEAEISVLAHFLLGANQFLENMLENATDRTYPGDEAVVDAYVALLRNGLARPLARGGRNLRATASARTKRANRRTRAKPPALPRRGRKR